MDEAPKSLPDTVLVDIDGTLLDSFQAHALTWSQAFAAGGFEIGFEKIFSLIGLSNDQLLINAVGIDAAEPDGQILTTIHRELFIRDHLLKIRAFPGARALIARILGEGFTVAVTVASSNDIYIIDKLLERADIADLVHATPIVSAKPQQTVLIGANPHCIARAHQSGIRTIAFQCGGWAARELSRAEAIYRDPNDLLRRFGSSNLARTPRQKYTDSYFPLN